MVDNPLVKDPGANSKSLKFILLLNIIILVGIGFLFYLVLNNQKNISLMSENLQNNYVDKEHYEKLKVNIPNAIGITPTDPSPNDTPYMAYEPVVYTGAIKKEKIPEEYELGDYWYILYFETPQLIETVAGDEYKDSLEVQASTIDSLEPFLNQNIEVEGRLSHGFAESRIVLVDQVTLK